jgi:YVTN family beta-propeller protein
MKNSLRILLIIIFGMFIWINAAQATPGFLITTTDNPINVTAGGTATITYTVQNTSGVDIPQIKYFPPALTTITGGTCGNSLAKNASCTIVLLLTIPAAVPVGQLQLGSLDVCGFGGRICGVPYFNQRVTVNVIVVNELVSIAITPTSATINTAGTQQFTAIGHFSDGSTQDITTSATWNSLNTAVATIVPSGSSGGLATGVSPGTTLITAVSGAVTSNFGTLNVSGIKAFVANDGSGTVSVIDTSSNTIVGSPITTGSGSIALAITPDGTKAYVVNQFGNSVSVILTATDTVTATVTLPTGAMPTAIAITPDGSKAYVANTSIGSVSVINTSTNTIIGSPITVGTTPSSLAITPDNSKVYVLNQGANTVSVINATTEAVIATVPVGTDAPGSTQVAITPDGSQAYVVNGGTNTVSVICTGLVSAVCSATDTVIATVTVGTGPFAVAITPDGTKAYVVNRTTSNVSVIDTATQTVIGSPISVGASSAPQNISITPDNTKAYVSNNIGNTVSVINTTAETVIATVPVGTAPAASAITADNAKVYVVNQSDGTVSVICTGINPLVCSATDTVIATVTVGSDPTAVAID